MERQGPEDGDDVFDGDDAFEGLTLDDDFVRAAPLKEPSASTREQLHRLREERRRLQQRPVGDLRSARRKRRRAKAGRVARGGIALAVLGGIVGGLWVTSRRNDDSSSFVHPDPVESDVVISDVGPIGPKAPPSPLKQATPIGQPPPLPAEPGPFRFLRQQSDGSSPVAYDPCQPIQFVVNGRTAPPQGDELLRSAFDRLSEVTGLKFIPQGETTEPPSSERAFYQPDRYPGTWAPVLIAWSDELEYPKLAGGFAGYGGSTSLTPPLNQSLYVTGQVVLDGPQLTKTIGRPRGMAVARGVILHELAHLVGLDHVEDSDQLMNPARTGGVTDYANGDLYGLALLGRGQCFPDI